MNKNQWLKNKIGSILSFISLGQYNSTFTLKGKNQHASILGGIVSILVFAILIFYSITTLIDVFQVVNYHLTATTRILEYQQDAAQQIVCDNNCDHFTLRDLIKIVNKQYFNISLEIGVSETFECNHSVQLYYFNNALEQKFQVNTLVPLTKFGSLNYRSELSCQYIFNPNQGDSISLAGEFPALFYVPEMNKFIGKLFIMTDRYKHQSFEIWTNESGEITNTGLITSFSTSGKIPETSDMIEIKFKVLKYFNQLSASLTQPTFDSVKKLYYNYYAESISLATSDIKVTTDRIYFTPDKIVSIYVRYPDTILGAISSIGGILAFFLNIGLILRFFHKRQLERKLTLEIEDEDQESLIKLKKLDQTVSFENYRQLIATVNKLIEKEIEGNKPAEINLTTIE